MKQATKMNDLFSALNTEQTSIELGGQNEKSFPLPKFLPGDTAFIRNTCEKVVIKTVNLEIALKDQTGKRDDGVTSSISYLVVGSSERFYESQILTKRDMLMYLDNQYRERLSMVEKA